MKTFIFVMIMSVSASAMAFEQTIINGDDIITCSTMPDGTTICS